MLNWQSVIVSAKQVLECPNYETSSDCDRTLFLYLMPARFRICTRSSRSLGKLDPFMVWPFPRVRRGIFWWNANWTISHTSSIDVGDTSQKVSQLFRA